MTEKSKIEALVLLAERADRYGSLEKKFPLDVNEAIKTIKLKQNLEKLSNSESSTLSSNSFTYGL